MNTSEAAFEVVGGGARSAGLGSAFAAAVGAVESVWFNAAGNARSLRNQAGVVHTVLYPGLNDAITLSSLAASGRLAGGNAQLGLSSLNGLGWEERVYLVGYGRPVHPRVALGANVRSVGWDAGSLSQRAVDVDIGAIYEAGWVRPDLYLRFAAVAGNLTVGNISAEGHSGGDVSRGWVLAMTATSGPHTVLADVDRRRGRSEIRVGLETRGYYTPGLTARLGASAVSAGWQGKELNAGFGYRWASLQFDYAYSYPIELSGLGGVHRMGFTYRRP
ncbi:MAG: hypothetical protein VX733_15285 [Candidatus Latescibacterota bacterium]|nr:hypothetical protein [Candidatus Latescibacterota bacterium]